MNNYWWLAGYPKSGNNWLSDLINYITIGDTYDFNNRQAELPFKFRNIDHTLAKSYPFFRTETPIDTTGIIRPKDQKIVSFDSSGLELSKQKALGCIYIARHPLDVCCSYYNYMKYTGNFDKYWSSFDSYVSAFLKHKGIPGKPCSSWIDNVASWTEQDKIPCLVLKYEDMRTEPIQGMKQICAFLKINHDEDFLIRGNEQFSFNTMKKHQEALIQANQPLPDRAPANSSSIKQGIRFINEGETYGYTTKLSPTQIQKGLNIFSDTLEKLGYNK